MEVSFYNHDAEEVFESLGVSSQKELDKCISFLIDKVVLNSNIRKDSQKVEALENFIIEDSKVNYSHLRSCLDFLLFNLIEYMNLQNSLQSLGKHIIPELFYPELFQEEQENNLNNETEKRDNVYIKKLNKKIN